MHLDALDSTHFFHYSLNFEGSPSQQLEILNLVEKSGFTVLHALNVEILVFSSIDTFYRWPLSTAHIHTETESLAQLCVCVECIKIM